MFQYLRVALGKERMKPNAAWWLLLSLLSSCDGDHMARHMVHIVHHIVASYSHTYGAYGTICNTTLLNITTGSPI